MTVVESSGTTAAPLRRAVWDTIWLVAQLPGMTESYERLLEYGEMVNHGVPTRTAAVILVQISSVVGRSADVPAAAQADDNGARDET